VSERERAGRGDGLSRWPGLLTGQVVPDWTADVARNRGGFGLGVIGTVSSIEGVGCLVS
jgi:hypothetical protein